MPLKKLLRALGGSTSLRVLIVEDDPVQMRLCASLCEAAAKEMGVKFSVTQSTRFEEALAVLGTQNFDLVIADVLLSPGGESGLKLLEIAQAKQKKTKFLVMSNLSKSSFSRLLRADATNVRYLEKPLTPTTFRLTLQALLGL